MDLSIMMEMFEASRSQNKQITIFLPGHTVALVVRAVHGTHLVEGWSREFSRIVVPIDQIVALAVQ